jgi:hypothetical protein
VGTRRLFGAVVIAVCVVVPMVEAFDTWDHTLSDGNDTEANVVIAALCVGVALTLGTSIVVTPPRSIATDARFQPTLPIANFTVNRHSATPIPTSNPPPLPLRI